MTKEQYESEINNSILFKIDRETDSVLWTTEARKLLAVICQYYKSFILSEKVFCDSGLEIVECCNECFRFYKESDGIFLHYLNASLKKKLYRKRAKEIVEQQRQGIKVSKTDDQKIRKLIRFVESKGEDIYSNETQTKLAKYLNVSIKEISIYIKMSSISVASDIIYDNEGEENSLFDLIPANENIANEAEEKEALLNRLQQISDAFNACQERQKSILSSLLTIKILPALPEYILKNPTTYSFINITILTLFLSGEELPTARQIAAAHGVAEQSASRTFANFVKKLRE